MCIKEEREFKFGMCKENKKYKNCYMIIVFIPQNTWNTVVYNKNVIKKINLYFNIRKHDKKVLSNNRKHAKILLNRIS